MAVFASNIEYFAENPTFNYTDLNILVWEKYWGKKLVPSDPPGVLRVPILGPNRGMFSKLNGPSPPGSGGQSYTKFSIGRFCAQWNSFGGDVIQFLKPQVFDVKTQIVLLKLNHKPTGAWACLSFSKKSGKFTIIQQEILKAHKCTSISIAKIP